MIVSKDIEFYRARLLNLADILERLPEEKDKDFKHSTYIDTKNMCSTSACVAGWAVLIHTEEGKKISALQNEMFKYVSKHSEIKKYSSAREELLSFVDKIRWMQLGMKVLGLGEKTAEKLFLPLDYFWDTIGSEKQREIGATNKQAALALRYLAATKDLRFRQDQQFNEKHMTKFVEKHRSN